MRRMATSPAGIIILLVLLWRSSRASPTQEYYDARQILPVRATYSGFRKPSRPRINFMQTSLSFPLIPVEPIRASTHSGLVTLTASTSSKRLSSKRLDSLRLAFFMRP